MPFYSWKDIAKDTEPNETLPLSMTRQGIVMGNTMIAMHEVIAGSSKSSDVPAAPLSHSHESPQITYVFEGRMIMTIKGEEKELGPHDFAYVPPFTEHGIKPLTDYVKAIDIWTPPRPDVVKRVEEIISRTAARQDQKEHE